MNITTAIKGLPYILAVAFPATLAAEVSGSIPTSSLLGYAFGAFVVTMTVLTLLADYRDAKPLQETAVTPAPVSSNSALALAA